MITKDLSSDNFYNFYNYLIIFIFKTLLFILCSRISTDKILEFTRKTKRNHFQTNKTSSKVKLKRLTEKDSRIENELCQKKKKLKKNQFSYLNFPETLKKKRKFIKQNDLSFQQSMKKSLKKKEISLLRHEKRRVVSVAENSFGKIPDKHINYITLFI